MGILRSWVLIFIRSVLPVILFLFSPQIFAAGKKQPERKVSRVTLVALSDFHGALEPSFNVTADGQKVSLGGAAVLAAYVKTIRENSVHPLVILDGGDLFQGSLVSNTAEGAPVVAFYNYLGVDAAAIGNHEFDYGPLGENTVVKHPQEDPRGAIKARVTQAKFPFLSANIFHLDQSRPGWLKASHMIERAGLKIGIVGASTEETPSTTIQKNLVGLEFPKPLAHVLREAQQLKKDGADILLLAIHAGGICKDNRAMQSHDLSSCDPGQELFQLLQALPHGLFDAVVGGHTHQGVSKVVNGMAVIQPYALGQTLMWAEVGGSLAPRFFDSVKICLNTVPSPEGPSCDRKAVEAYRGKLERAKFMGQVIEEDTQVEKLLLPDFERVRSIKETPIGALALQRFERDYFEENPLGNLVADSLKGFAFDGQLFPELKNFFKGTVPSHQYFIAMTNNGGIRTELPAGLLNYGHIFDVLPFDNRLALFRVTGVQLRQMIEVGISRKHGGLAWSGLGFTADQCQVQGVKVNGLDLDRNAIYYVVSNDYLAGGGSGFSQLKIPPSEVILLDEAPMLRDALVKYFREQKDRGGRELELDPAQYFNRGDKRQSIDRVCETEDR